MSDFGSVLVYTNFGFRNTRKMESEISHNRLKVVIKNNDFSRQQLFKLKIQILLPFYVGIVVLITGYL